MNALPHPRAEVRKRAIRIRGYLHPCPAQSQSGVKPPQSKGSRHVREAHLPAERWRNPKRVGLILKANWNKSLLPLVTVPG